MKRMNINTVRTLAVVFVCLLAITSCNKNVAVTPTPNKIDPGQGAGNAVITLTGSGLRNVQSIVFDLGNVPVAFNTNFNTDNAVIFRVPVAANVGQQHIVFTTTAGYQFSVPFTVLAVPSLTSAFPAEWEAGGTVTINGNYLSSVSHVAFDASTDTATIISETATSLVLQMPASSVSTTKLVIYNNAGGSTTPFSLLNMDKQLKFFTDKGYGSGMQDWSWDNSTISTDFAVSGTHSLKEKYASGAWAGMSFHYDNTINTNDYQALTLWIKGGTGDNLIDVSADGVVSGSGGKTTITVPAAVWTYFTIPMSGNFDNTVLQRFDFQMHGPTGGDQTVYFDNVILVKK
jgi:hypothetical protein